MNPTLVLAAFLLLVWLATLEPRVGWRHGTRLGKDRR